MQILGTKYDDPQYILKNRRLHRRLARFSFEVLHSIWDPFGRFYHRTRYPPYKPLKLRSRRRCSQSQSRLLMLPPEIRFIIWDYVMASGTIALYRARDRITYDLMPEDSPQNVINITPQTIRKAVEGRTSLKASKMHKISLLSVLQTCQMIYLETLHLLYQANTFVSLQNTISIDFCNSALSAHLSLINSLHIHFQFRELFYHNFATRLGRQDPDPYNEYTFFLVCRQVSQSMPNLRTLSIFLQGPLMQPQTYENISRCLTRMQGELKDLNFMAVRFPQLALDSWVAALPGKHEYHRRDIDGWLVFMRDHFHVLQPPIGNGQQSWEVADLDTGSEKGWRLGTMYQIGNLGLDTIEMRNYAIFTEAEDLGSDIERREP